MYDYLKNSGSLYIDQIGEDFYNNHWDDVLNHVSSSGGIGGHQFKNIDELDTWLKSSKSDWDFLKQNMDSNGND